MECPTCHDTFPTIQGMRQHHTKVHGEALPNRECRGCGSRFYDPKARLKYCPDCNPNAGENNGNWRGAKETASCRSCGASFEYYPSDKDGVYCRTCVASADGLLPENPARRHTRVAVKCETCGAEIEVLPSRLSSQKRGFFCDLDCYGEWLSSHVVGPDHHQWEGGTIAYGRRWWRVRRQALERDDHRCQQCGRDADELGREPDVHHLEAVRSHEAPEDAHRLDNVVTLCRPCHRRVEAGTIELE